MKIFASMIMFSALSTGAFASVVLVPPAKGPTPEEIAANTTHGDLASIYGVNATGGVDCPKVVVEKCVSHANNK